jgi:hypothetical protein
VVGSCVKTTSCRTNGASGPRCQCGRSAMADAPYRNDGVTIACPRCGRAFAPSGRRRFRSDACRQAAWRHRQPVPLPALPASVAKPGIVYECPSCGVRLLGEQRCPECQVFCRRVGPGGPCPHCDEPVVLADLIDSLPSGRETPSRARQETRP